MELKSLMSLGLAKKKKEREREKTDILMKYDWGVPQQDAFVVGETVLFKVFWLMVQK